MRSVAMRAGPWGAGVTLLLTLGVLLASLGVQWVLGRFLPEDLGFYWAMSLGVSGVVELGCVLVWVRLRRGPDVPDYLALRGVPLKTLLGWVAAALLFAAAADGITWWSGRPIVPDVMREAYATAGWRPALWLALVLVAPVVEEGVFRGFLFRGLEASPLGPGGAILLSAALWTVTHGQYDGFSLGIVMAAGVLLGVARWRTGSLAVSLILHMILNAIAVAEAHAVVWGGY